jgi:hypothetical protein
VDDIQIIFKLSFHLVQLRNLSFHALNIYHLHYISFIQYFDGCSMYRQWLTILGLVPEGTGMQCGETANRQ